VASGIPVNASTDILMEHHTTHTFSIGLATSKQSRSVVVEIGVSGAMVGAAAIAWPHSILQHHYQQQLFDFLVHSSTAFVLQSTSSTASLLQSTSSKDFFTGLNHLDHYHLLNSTRSLTKTNAGFEGTRIDLKPRTVDKVRLIYFGCILEN
jgi:hypothetical protein